MRLVLINQQLFNMERREDCLLIRTLHLFIATCQLGQGLPCHPRVLQRAGAGVTFPSLICPYITLSSCQRQGGQEVYVQEVAFQRPSYCDMWKGNRGLIPDLDRKAGAGCCKSFWFAFFRKEARTQSLDVNTPVL